MPEFAVQTLLETTSVVVRDVRCPGGCRHAGAEECSRATHLVFPYRGVYQRHLGRQSALADTGQVLFFNGGESFRVSHPIGGSDASLVLALDAALLDELAPLVLKRAGDAIAFRHQRLRIDARAQVLVALLRHSLCEGRIEPLEAESLALTLAQRAMGPRTTHVAGSTSSRQKLVDRAKLVLGADPTRRWTLAEVATAVGVSPVYLTQSFQQVEGMPLYRYQLRLRLARALDLIPDCDDLAALGQDLGFSSHSHFSAAFTQTYGRSPSAFRRIARGD
jgi:AraC family transcriptional regulator